jgi:ketosteroid isomerase-like protein
MRILMKFFPSMILMLLIQTTLSAQSLKVDDKTRSFLSTFRAMHAESLTQAKPESIAQYYHDNIRLMVEFQRTTIGKNNVLLYHKSLTDRFAISTFDMTDPEIMDLGKMVVEFGTLAIALRSKSTGEGHALQGKYVSVWQRNDAGKLLLITTGWNYNENVNFGDQMRFPAIPVIDVAVDSHLPINSNISFELAALNRWMEAVVSQHDAELWSRFYTDDAVFFAQRHIAARGRELVDDYIKHHVEEIPVMENLTIRNDRIDVLGSYVLEYASHIAVWRRDNNSGVGRGKDLRIWRRESDGSLKIFRHIGMYD